MVQLDEIQKKIISDEYEIYKAITLATGCKRVAFNCAHKCRR